MARYYVGEHRLTWQYALIFLIAVPMFSYLCFAAFDDAAYNDLITTGHKSILDRLPRPVFQALTTALALSTIVFVPMKLFSVFKSKPCFEIDTTGIRTWPILRKSRFMSWDQMESANFQHKTLFFRGEWINSTRHWISLDLIGHDRDEVLDIISSYRPDLVKDLM